MKYDKTTIVGVAICVVLFFSWNKILQKLGYDVTPRPAPQEQAAAETSEAPTPAPAEPTPGTPAPAVADTPAVTPPAPAPTSAAPVAVPNARDLVAKASKTWPVGTASPIVIGATDGTLTLRIDPNGGGVTSAELAEYLQDGKKNGGSGKPIEMGRPELPMCALNLAQAGWVAGVAEIVRQDEAGCTIRRPITSSTGETATLVEDWSLLGADKPYQFSYTITVEGNGQTAVELRDLAVESGGLPPTMSPERAKFRGSASSGLTYSLVGAKRPDGYDAAKLVKSGDDARAELASAPINWVGIHSQYFLFYLSSPDDSTFTGVIPSLETFKGDPQVKVGRNMAKQPWVRARTLLPPLQVAKDGSSSMTFHCYAGPKKLQILADMPGDVSKVMDMDRFMIMHVSWMGWLTKFLLSCLVSLKTVFSGPWGYGWAIIIITVGVKLIFFPLSHKGTQSMRKMQELQPQIKELRERYKDDAQKMYRKQQELFKENNVSQLGGCLPMLVQIPVFFGLYNTFRSAIELRQASFLWVADLSLPDTLAFSPDGLPIRPLALVMSGTMLIQQRLTPSGDANQQRMMMFMSLFFLWIFYGMPAGLTLYWTTNQILTIAQTLITRRLEERKKAAQAGTGDAVGERA